MRFVSLFAGVGGFDLGFEQAGMTCLGQVEIDKNARAILEKHWPKVPKHDDVTTAKEWADELGLVGRTDLVCGGFPCQDVSVAGRRAGLAGERTGLFWDALSFASHVQARLIVLENVPGLLSSNGGRDFGVILTALADAGYSHLEWRVLDSQFFGVPQRRRRLFIIGRSGGDSGRALFLEREGVPRHLEARQPARSDIAGSLTKGFGSGGPDDNAGQANHLVIAERERETGEQQQHARSSQHRDNRNRDTLRPRHGISRTYQATVGTFTAGAHPGSYNGQDAYNDMLIIGETNGRVDEITKSHE
jgi:DNA (cytosine-5)-methyltransferase 1